MACAHPLTINNPYFTQKLCVSRSSMKFSPTNPLQFEVPCGYCLNCRVDKRNFLEDVFKYHFNNCGNGAFVTLTYSDYFVPHNSQGVPSLRKDDVSKFIERLRKYLKRLPISDSRLNPDFKYICVGEIGGSGVTNCVGSNGRKHQYLIGRPHYHFLFAGLDYSCIKRILKKEWKFGIVDCGPIQKGGIRYVLKYYDKQQTKKSYQETFIDQGLEPPFKKQSFGLCSDFILSKRDEIIRLHGSYKKGLKERPIPSYYKKVLFTSQTSSEKWLNVRKESKRILSNFKWQPENKMNYSLRELNEYKKYLARLREENLLKSLNQFIPPSFSFEHLNFVEIIS